MFKRKVQNDRLVLRGSGLNNLRSDGVEKILKDDVMFFLFYFGWSWTSAHHSRCEIRLCFLYGHILPKISPSRSSR